MKIGLFIPCYVNEFYPNVAIATIELLEKFNYIVEYPLDQTCCGQPLANSGLEDKANSCYNNFVNLFSEYDYIVCPSGSCTYHVKHHYDVIDQTPSVVQVRNKIYDLVDFITEFCDISRFSGEFEQQIGIHLSCHALRGLKQAKSAEFSSDQKGKIYNLLQNIKNIKISQLNRSDECCGFGGAFSFYESDVSSNMGCDRLADHIKNNTQVLTSGDMSCLMHMEGLVRRKNMPIEVMHIAQILNKVFI
ncbi:MAG: (Fe-S)-binding protein [Burkholderiales bacterium]|nr:(Fe-S)-binding protein [Burkholderiales bacterium]